MYPNIAAKVQERISQTVSQLEISKNYQALMHSVISQALKPYEESPSTQISTFFLPAVIASALGKEEESALGVTSAWLLLQLSAHLLDKVEDQEVNETIFNHDRPDLILNLTTGLIFAAEFLLDHLEEDGIDPRAAADLRLAFNKYILRVCGGQHDDLSFAQPDLSLCWQITQVKSGMFFGLGCFAGARLATADADCLSLFWDYGVHLGIIKQIADDVESFIRQENRKSDFVSGKWTLPVAYSVGILPEPTSGILKEMLARAPYDQQAEKNAREKMVQAGALIYLKLETTKHAFQAKQAIQQIQLENFEQKDLTALLTQTAGLEEFALS